MNERKSHKGESLEELVKRMEKEIIAGKSAVRQEQPEGQVEGEREEVTQREPVREPVR